MRTKTKPAIFTLIATGLLLSSFSILGASSVQAVYDGYNYYCPPKLPKADIPYSNIKKFHFVRAYVLLNKNFCGYASFEKGYASVTLNLKLDTPRKVMPNFQQGTLWPMSSSQYGAQCSDTTLRIISPHRCPFTYDLTLTK